MAVSAADDNSINGGVPGSVYVFTWSGTTNSGSWDAGTELTPSTTIGATAGSGVAVATTPTEETVVVGIPYAAQSLTIPGEIAVYVKPASTNSWSGAVKTIIQPAGFPPRPADNLGFGCAVSADGKTIVASAVTASVNVVQSGTAFVMTQVGGSWSNPPSTVEVLPNPPPPVSAYYGGYSPQISAAADFLAIPELGYNSFEGSLYTAAKIGATFTDCSLPTPALSPGDFFGGLNVHTWKESC